MSATPPVTISSLETYAQGWDEAWYPVGPRSFAKRARAAGWDVRVGFSRGATPGAAKDSWEVRDIIGVWMDGFGKRAAVMWERNPEAEFSARKLDSGVKPGELPSGMVWKCSGGLIMIGPGMAFPHANLTEMDVWVEAHGEVPPSWYEAARDRVLAARAKAKENAQDKPSKAKEREHA